MNWGPLEEKQGGGCSMSRLIALMFAVTYSSSFVFMARSTNIGISGLMSWPYAALGIAILLSVPFQSLCKTFVTWFSSAPGKAMLQTLVTKFAAAEIPGLGTKVTTTVATGAASPNTDQDKINA